MCNPEACHSICHRSRTWSIISECAGGKDTTLNFYMRWDIGNHRHRYMSLTLHVWVSQLMRSKDNDPMQWKCNISGFLNKRQSSTYRYITNQELRTWGVIPARYTQCISTNMIGLIMCRWLTLQESYQE